MNSNSIKNHPFINPNNEIKIGENTDVCETINFIYDLFLKKNYKTIYISGLITEIIKSKIPGLYQITDINSIESLNNEINNENTIIPRLSITLTFIEPSEDEKQNLGYQEPLNIGLISELSKRRNLYK